MRALTTGCAVSTSGTSGCAGGVSAGGVGAVGTVGTSGTGGSRVGVVVPGGVLVSATDG